MLMCLRVCEHKELCQKLWNEWRCKEALNYYKSSLVHTHDVLDCGKKNCELSQQTKEEEKFNSVSPTDCKIPQKLKQLFFVHIFENYLMSRPTTEPISSISEMTILRQTQGGSMAAYQPPRSKFMIHDILGSNGKFNSPSDDRTPSPQSKDFSLFLNSIPDHDDESDCDSSK